MNHLMQKIIGLASRGKAVWPEKKLSNLPYLLNQVYNRTQKLYIVGISSLILVFSSEVCLSVSPADALPFQLKITVRGVYNSKISVSPFNGVRTESPFAVKENVASGDTFVVTVPRKYLPGEFLVRFDYKADQGSDPYPGELQLYLNKNELTVKANPMYLHGDSLVLVNDIENKVYQQFMADVMQRKQQIGLLQQLLENYDNKNSSYYNESILVYRQRVNAFNKWVGEEVEKNEGVYVSHLFGLEREEPVNWKLDEADRLDDLAGRFFQSINLNDPLILRSRQFNQLMNRYMGLFGVRATSEVLRDSLFTEAGQIACTAASKGAPEVYGWFVDYFYNGYETYNIASGMKMLATHLENPNCLTQKRQEINRRLEGMKELQIGTTVKPIHGQDRQGQDFIFSEVNEDKSYGLLVFYDSDCGHCTELLDELSQWYALPGNRDWFDIYSIALDEDPKTWKEHRTEKPFPWNDLLAPGGINSKAASDYYILSTPVIFVVDKDGKLLDIPEELIDIDLFLNE